MRTTEQVTHDVTVMKCDFCKNAQGMGRGIKQCPICGRDVCSDCAVKTSEDLSDKPDFYDDYPDYYCKECWEMGKQIRNQIINIRQTAHHEEDMLMLAWEQLCKLKLNKACSSNG